MLENITMSFQSVWSHKVRSFLTMLGIIIGIASIITIVSTIKGTNDQIKQNLVGSGINAVVVRLHDSEYNSPVDFQYNTPPESVRIMTEETRQAIEELDLVKDASLFLERTYSSDVFYKNTAYSGSVVGIDSHYFDVYGYGIMWGRGFIASDYEDGRKVAIVDRNTVTKLFGGADPVGEVIEIGSDTFTVVGVVEQKETYEPVIKSLNDYYMYASNESGNVFIPSSTWPVVYRFDEPQSVAVSTARTDDMTKVGKDVADYLTENQIMTDDGKYQYKSVDLLEQAKQLQEMSNATNKQLVWIAGISLVVGGIGVMNIMLVTVTERTREIGLKKAIGAKKKRILRQFLTEAAVLTSLGGILGVIVGIGLAQLLSSLMNTPTAISVPAILISVVFSMIIGILFGLIPAVKASKLNPIEALRRE